jgi:hypothetical protein
VTELVAPQAAGATWRSSDTIDTETRQLAELFAAQVATALKHVMLEATLSTALQSRTMIGTTVGIVMERYGVDNERAFAYLARVSQHSNIKLKDVAREVVEGLPHTNHSEPSTMVRSLTRATVARSSGRMADRRRALRAPIRPPGRGHPAQGDEAAGRLDGVQLLGRQVFTLRSGI